LSIRQGDNGGAVVHCHAGCAAETVVAALGLTMADLMPRKAESSRRPDPQPARPAVTFATAAKAVEALERKHGPRAGQWAYFGAKGEPLGLVVRWSLDGGGKDIRPVSKTPTGWIIGAMATPRPLYNLAALLARPGERVYGVEGEKAADACMGLGLLSTTSSGGAKAAGKTDWTPLAGRDVVILPDADPAGEGYAADVVAGLAKLSPPARVRVVRLRDAWPDLADGGDIADVVASGEGADAIRAKLAALVEAAEPEEAATPTLAADAFKPFPVDAMPDPPRAYVLELAAATNNDPACAALAVLVVLAGVIGNRVAALVKRGWVEPAILWGANVARSGSVKSAVLKLAARPLLEMYKEAREKFAEELAAYETARQRFEVARSQWEAAQKKGAGPSDPPLEPEPPIEWRIVVSDVTCEKIGALLQDNPLGLLLLRDELAAWIGAFDRYAGGGKGSDAPTWLSFHDGIPVFIDRKSAAGTIFVERAAVSVLGSIQPRTLRRVFGAAERESGLLARLLLVQPPTRPAIWTDEELSDATATAWAHLLRGLLDIQPGQDEHGQPRPRLIPLTADAKAAWVAWHDAHGRDVADISADDLAAHFAKLKGICIRLALLLAAVEGVATGQAVSAIGLDHLQRAIAITEWFKHEARRVYGILSESDEEGGQRQLVELIQRKGGAMSIRQLQQTCREYRKPLGAAQRALDALAEAGLGRWEQQAPGPHGGRPTRVLRVIGAPTEPPPAPTKPPTAAPKPSFVGVGAVGAGASEGAGEWGEL
jgi:hypothetical protein